MVIIIERRIDVHSVVSQVETELRGDSGIPGL